MAVHPRSVYAAMFEFERANGGQKWPLPEAALQDIIAEVHAVAKKHNRAREIQLRMKKAVGRAALSVGEGSDAGQQA